MAASGSKAGERKRPHDHTITRRSQALASRLKEEGGWTTTFRANGEVARMVQDLISAGDGTNKQDLLTQLIRRRHARKFGKTD